MWPRGASGRRARAGLVAGLLLPLATLAQTPVSFTVNLSGPRTAISPYIYGTNALLNPADGYTSLRLGGNRLTGYNWETNASNAGADYNNQNDNYLCSPSQANLSAADCLLPGRVVSAYWQRARAAGIPYTLVTLPMAGYVVNLFQGKT